MPEAQVVDVVNFMPERVVVNADALDQGDALTDNAFFRGVAERRFASPEFTSAELGAQACRKLFERTGVAAGEIDLVIYHCMFNDTFWPGIGPAVQSAIGASRAAVLQVDTSCCSWLSGLQTARAFIESGIHRNVVVLTVTNFISRLPEFQKSKRSWVLGDGATATLVAPGERSVLSAYERSHGENYGLLRFEPDVVDGLFKNYWERGCGPITVNFTQERLERLRDNAMSLVPDAVGEALRLAGLDNDEVGWLITHQPNESYLREWRERTGIGEPRAHDTLAKYGNLFAGSIPVTVADALDEGLVKPGDVLALGTFANGGDMVSAMALRWAGSHPTFRQGG